MKSAKDIITHVVKYLSGLARNNLKNITNTECQVFTDMEYLKDNNLISHMTGNKVFDSLLSTVLYREETDAIYVTEYYKVLTDYFDYSIYEYTGLTIDDFFNLTSEMYDDVIHMVIIRIKKKSEALDNLKTKYDNGINDNGVDTYDDITDMYRV